MGASHAKANSEIADNAAIAKELYDRLSVRSGTVDEILNRASRELADGGKPNDVKARAYADTRDALGAALTGATDEHVGLAGENEGGPAAGKQRHLDQLRDAGTISEELHRNLSRRTEDESRAPEARGRAGAEGTGAVEQNWRAEGRGESGEAEPLAEIPRVASPDALKPYDVARVPLDQLHLDPKRFQYKMNTDASGVTNLLKGLPWNEENAGAVSVWRDPEDGKTYVVNGHHRYQLAQETEQPDIAVKMMPAKDAAEARAKGAIQNIAAAYGSAATAGSQVFDLYDATNGNALIAACSFSMTTSLALHGAPASTDACKGSCPGGAGARIPVTG